MIDTTFYKKAEKKILEWLERPEQGYCIDRIPDQMTGMYGSKKISDFTFYKYPYYYYIESKSTWEDRFEFSMITDYQYDNLLRKDYAEDIVPADILDNAEHFLKRRERPAA